MRKILIILSSLLSLCAYAQAPTKAEVPPPPRIERLDTIEHEVKKAPPALGKPEPKNKVVEKHDNNGKVTEVQVKSGNSNYTLHPNNPEKGHPPVGTREGDANRAAQWTILEFGGKKESREAEPPAVLPPAPIAKPVPASSVKQ